jgi:acetyltransferase-like isoleucine patch superfamily enzyme
MKSLLRKWYRFVRFYIKKNQISNKGENNIIKVHQSYASNISISVIGNNNVIDIHPLTRLSNLKITLQGNNGLLKIGEGVVWKKGEVWLADHCNTLLVGNRTSIEEAHIAVGDNNTSISLGEDCMLAYDIEIRSTDSHSVLDLESGLRINSGKSITIGNHVWVGAHSTILKGCSIGNHAIIASGAVITKNAEANTIYGGFPAKPIRKNVSWSRERIPTEPPQKS